MTPVEGLFTNSIESTFFEGATRWRVAPFLLYSPDSHPAASAQRRAARFKRQRLADNAL
ncbi:hypothetical protein [Vandammella animalimorsus]|uniref:hypothetical protein n=1 Tax=Vandammella animalimorsus TaxID=2029117 RepID=UPI0015535A2E|nr:hypothetical protein [Vandammella animalimorsus]